MFKYILNFFRKERFVGDLSRHRAFTTKYEDLCM